MPRLKRTRQSRMSCRSSRSSSLATRFASTPCDAARSTAAEILTKSIARQERAARSRARCSARRLEPPAQQPDPQSQQCEEREQLWPHHGEEAALPDLAALLDHRLSLPLL